MNRDEAIQRAEVAMAWARGETIQINIGPDSWQDLWGPGRSALSGPQIFNIASTFRIKPKPLECWAGVHDDGTPTGCTIWRDDEPDHMEFGCKWVRMREVE